MNGSEELRLLNLSFFLKEFLLPEVGPAREKRQRRRAESTYTSAALFEAFAWLYLGVQIRYFPALETRRLLELYRADIFPKDEDQLSILRNLFPELSHIFERLLVVEQILLETESPFYSARELLTPFQSALLLASEFARDPIAQIFSMVFGFEPDPTWKRLVEQAEVDPEEITLILNLDGSERLIPTTETIYAGFFRALDYMEASRQLFEGLTGITTSDKDLLDLRRRVLQIQAWRINVRDRRDRFEKMTEYVGQRLDLQLFNMRTDADKGFFVRHVNALVQYWLGEAETFTQAARA